MLHLMVGSIDDELIQRLRNRAQAHGRTVEAEHRLILEQALKPADNEFWRRAEALQDATRNRAHTDATLLIRADRDRDG